MKLKPFLKYLGGKTALMPKILENLPNEFNNYYEPFVGGGSVFLELLSQFPNKELTISDININLMNCYRVIKNNLQELIIELSKEDIYKNEKECYYKNRDRYNNIKFNNENLIEQTALFIYLNKCGYNGMHRLNKSGKFNIPFGKMNNPLICDIVTLTNVSNSIQNTNILNGDYSNILNIKEYDFVYFDPPYDGTFTDYNADVFGEKEQIKLKELVDLLTEKNIYVLLSNSNTVFIRNLYKDYEIKIIDSVYSLGGNNSNRGVREEVLIKNY